ncbi:MAG: hypothetical protein KDA29_00685 [Phycisphaerales bacterium]|nr:hypothetical protein [Phycisphaerales bacterium]
MLASALMLFVIAGCAKEWREDADRTYQQQMQACREFGCSQEEIEAINKWYRDTKSAILAYELAESAEDRKAARKIILDLLPKIEIKVGNEDSSDSENIQGDDVEVSIDLVAAADLAAMPSEESTPAGQDTVVQNLSGAGRPVLLDDGLFFINGYFSRTYEGLLSSDVAATWAVSGRLKLGDAQSQPNGSTRYPVLSGSFDGDPVQLDDQIPMLQAFLDTSVDRYIEVGVDGDIFAYVRFRVETGYENINGDTEFGGAFFYRLSMPAQQLGQGYRLETDGVTAGSTVFPMRSYPVADWNQDGLLDEQDLASYLVSYGGFDPTTDLNGDGLVTSDDLTLFEDYHSRSMVGSDGQ